MIVLLEPREHFAGPADLPDEHAREQGVMLGRVERAVLAVGGIARVHIGRWGEGAEHLHWWFIGRPDGFGGSTSPPLGMATHSRSSRIDSPAELSQASAADRTRSA